MTCQICKKNPATIHVTEIHYVSDKPAASAPPGTKNSPTSSPSASSNSSSSGSGKMPAPQIDQKNLCETCAQGLQLPHAPVDAQKIQHNIWKLLQHSARKARQEGSLACPDCGMTLAEFRSKGRLGCPQDYRIFHAHLQPLLQRVHNASEHHGRLPGTPTPVVTGDESPDATVSGGDGEKHELARHLTRLRSQLQEAIRAEAYENAARLRDQIQELESQAPNAG